jgi:hypothetical protein
MGVDPRTWPRPVVLPDPPPIGPGQTVGAPDFVGVGVQKAGTSWWFDLLGDHPKIDRPPFKELHYFDSLYRPGGDRNLERYHQYFPRSEGQLIGEWTPRYMADPWSLDLLARAAPDAQILVLLRDPFDRFRSGLTHDVSRGAPDSPLVVSIHVERSDYVGQLERLFSLFDRDRVLVQQYEACRADVAGELARTQRFLGLEPTDPVDPGRQVNATSVDKSPVADHVADVLRRQFATMAEPLSKLVPELDLDLWPSMRGSDSGR